MLSMFSCQINANKSIQTYQNICTKKMTVTFSDIFQICFCLVFSLVPFQGSNFTYVRPFHSISVLSIFFSLRCILIIDFDDYLFLVQNFCLALLKTCHILFFFFFYILEFSVEIFYRVLYSLEIGMPQVTPTPGAPLGTLLFSVASVGSYLCHLFTCLCV